MRAHNIRASVVGVGVAGDRVLGIERHHFDRHLVFERGGVVLAVPPEGVDQTHADRHEERHARNYRRCAQPAGYAVGDAEHDCGDQHIEQADNDPPGAVVDDGYVVVHPHPVHQQRHHEGADGCKERRQPFGASALQSFRRNHVEQAGCDSQHARNHCSSAPHRELPLTAVGARLLPAPRWWTIAGPGRRSAKNLEALPQKRRLGWPAPRTFGSYWCRT